MKNATVEKEVSLKSVNDSGKVTSHNSSHPVGTTLGTIGGAAAGVSGTMIAGALAGTVVGPAGAALGAAVGGVVGAMTGHTIAAQVNPKEEDLFWRTNYASCPYVKSGVTYTTYQPAYMYGVNSFVRNEGRSFDEVESDMATHWLASRGESSMEWEEAKPAARDAYNRLETSFRK